MIAAGGAKVHSRLPLRAYNSAPATACKRANEVECGGVYTDTQCSAVYRFRVA